MSTDSKKKARRMYRILKENDDFYTKLVILGIITLIFAAIFLMGFPVRTVKADNNTIYIQTDGSINPPTAPILRVGETYTLTANITESIVIKKDNIVVDGAGYMVYGVGDVGLDLSHRKNVTVRNFRVAEFSIGVSLNSSDNNSIMFNNVTNNKYAGIQLYSSDHNRVMNNIALNNKYGIRVVNSSDCNVSWNNVTNNGPIGIFLNSRPSATSNFTLLENDISNNDVGIWLWDSSGNTVYHNNFFNNSIHVSIHNSYNNMWDNGFEGNYWDDYLGADTDKDAIGDIPYHIDENNQDKYPLMAKFRQFSIQIENHFYKIGMVCNSTILSDKKRLSFKLSNVQGIAFFRLRIPNALVEPSYSIVVGPPYAEYNPLDYRIVETNETYTWIYFIYSHSEEATITIVKAVKPLPFWFQWWFWGICVLVVTTATIFGKYLLQRKTIETYKRLLGSFQQVSHFDKAKTLFEADVRRCRRKLEDFTRKYNIRIRHREENFEDVLKRIGIEEKNKK